MKKALVTGANGFIGSHLVRELLKRGYEVNCLVRHTSDLSSLDGLPVSSFVGNVLEPQTLAAPIKEVDYVYHLAAELMATEQDVFEQAIVTGTTNMLNAAKKYAGKTLKRFLYVSSQSAAGPGKDVVPIDETAVRRPISWYGEAKKKAEDVVHSFAKDMPVTMVRPALVYGEREKDVNRFYGPVKLRLQPKLGSQPKYLVVVYVGDLVRGIADAAESGQTLDQVYFLNHPQVVTAKDTIRVMARAMEKSRGLMFPLPLLLVRLFAPFFELIHEFTRQRPWMTRDKAREFSQRFWVASSAKAGKDFGWKAQFDLLSGMKITIKKFLEEWAVIRKMPLEKSSMLWIKYILFATFIGFLIEASAAYRSFYTYYPWWLFIIAVVLWHGLILGTLAKLWRMRTGYFQFVSGTILNGLAEILNALKIYPGAGWTFSPPFDNTNIWVIWVRSLVLGLEGGIFIVLINYLLRWQYKRRMRLG